MGSQQIAYVGVDVSKDTLDVAFRDLAGSVSCFRVTNDVAGFTEIAGRVTAPEIEETRVVFEATGPYSQALAMFLSAQPQRIRMMMVQPKAARDFARASMRRAKTDRVDAASLCEFAQRMEFVPTSLPERWILQLRRLSRYLAELVDRRAELKNERHSELASGEANAVILTVLAAQEAALDKHIDDLQAAILAELERHEAEYRHYQHMVEIQGLKDRSAARLLPELLALPRHLTAREVVAHAGLDPKPKQSGKSGQHGSWPISKQGNGRIRRSLYLVALTAVRSLPPAKEVYNRLRERGKLKKVAIVAVMRKLLGAIWMMIVKNEPFKAELFTGKARAAAA